MPLSAGPSKILAPIGIGMLLMIPSSMRAETGSFKIHRMLHELGEERYEIATAAGRITVNATFEYSDRGRTRGTTAALRLNSDYTPLSLELSGEGGPYAANIQGG